MVCGDVGRGLFGDLRAPAGSAKSPVIWRQKPHEPVLSAGGKCIVRGSMRLAAPRVVRSAARRSNKREWEQPGVASDTFSCVVCGAGVCHPVYPAALPWVKQCAGCGVRCTWPQPSDDELAACYDAEYAEAFGRHGTCGVEDPAMKEAQGVRLLLRVERQIGVGRLLDVGCGMGEMLASAARRGWQVAGIEPNRCAARCARQRVPQADVFCGPVEVFPVVAGAFDVITCLEVIEHLREPAAALSRLYGCLRPGGLLVATTPDAGGVHARLSGSIGTAIICGTSTGGRCAAWRCRRAFRGYAAGRRGKFSPQDIF